jgi:hypothetical protein
MVTTSGKQRVLFMGVEMLILLAQIRQSHHTPRIVTVPVLLLVGILRVHFLYLNPKICKYQIVSTDILYRSCRK